MDVYSETSPGISRVVAKATDSELSPLIDRFLGKIIDEDQENLSSQGSLIPSTSPMLPTLPLDLGGIGYCGAVKDASKGVCKLAPPISCYTCVKFSAKKNGPHHRVLLSLESYSNSIRDFVDPEIVEQLDDTRKAVQQVVEMIEEQEHDGK